MQRTRVLLTLALGVGIAVGMRGNQILSAQQPPVTRTDLQKTDLTGIAGQESVMVLVE